jgi:hypothetical protein
MISLADLYLLSYLGIFKQRTTCGNLEGSRRLRGEHTECKAFVPNSQLKFSLVRL